MKQNYKNKLKKNPNKMNLKEAMKTLEDYNKWRLGAELDQPNPKEITEALDIAINIMKQLT